MAQLQTMLFTFANNAATALGGLKKDDDVTSFKKPKSGNFSVAWFFAAALGASVLLRLLDMFFFFEEEEAMISELCAFGAFAAGAVVCVRGGKGVKPVQWSGKTVAKETADSKPKASPPRRAVAAKKEPSSPNHRPQQHHHPQQHADNMMFLLSNADSALVSDILEAGHKGSFVEAETRFQELVQSLSKASAAMDEPVSKSSTSALRPVVAAHQLVELCIQAGDPKRAAAWLEALHDCGLRCTSKTLHWVLDELSNGASRTEAAQLFSRMLAAGAQMDIACYQLLFERLAGDDATIQDYLHRLGQRGCSELVTGYIALIRSFAVAGDRKSVV